MMWSWKLIYEDETFNLFCDIDNVVGSEELDEGIFAGVECYRSLPEKIAVWVSIGIRDRGILKKYIERRKKAGFSSDGYDDFSYTLGLVELDAVNNLYRVIPAMDLDEKDQQLGTSSLLDGTKDPLLKGIKGDWSKIGSPKTSKAIKLLFNFFYNPPSQRN
ncbi:MAG: hypothetical protein H6Q54_455 [Deltaproteobacteria bacterium]|jgi:hypothetical protein|nr:hypothetical protein [Deltaproteobacteria bacterium]